MSVVHTRPQVLVYGSLRKGMSNHCLLDKSPYIATVTVTEPFKMLDLGAFPALVEDTVVNSLVGEVYSVDEEVMEDLDRLEGHPDWYKRRVIETPVGAAWVYVMPDKHVHSHRPVISGDWVVHIKGENHVEVDDIPW